MRRLRLIAVAVSLLGLCNGCSRDQAGPEEIPPPVTTGMLGVSITGLPIGSAASVRVAGPNFYSANLTASHTLTGLDPGQYQVFGNEVFTSSASFLPNPGVQSVTVVADSLSRVEMHYAGVLSMLTIMATGLPVELQAILHLVGPDGLTRELIGSNLTLQQLVPGPYVVQTDDLTYLGDLYRSPSDIPFTLAGGAGPLIVVPYSRGTTHLEITITGLPEGQPASVRVTNGQGFEQLVTRSDTLRGLGILRYTVTAEDVVTPGGEVYRPTPAIEQFDLHPRPNGVSRIAYALSP